MQAFACKVVCAPKTYSNQEIAEFTDRIQDEYLINLLLDNLPVSVPNPDDRTFSMGIPLGARDAKGGIVLYNHLAFHVKVNTQPNGKKRVVSFQARPHSVKHTADSCTENFDPGKLEQLRLPSGAVTWSYGIRWEESTEAWATRWDNYLNVSDSEVHWFSIVNSLLIVFFLSGMVAVIMMRTLRRDIAHYNTLDDTDELQEETGWKLVHTDVFRPPPCASLLAAYAGTGVQLLGMSFVVLTFALLGFLSPAHRGGLLTCMMLFFCFLGVYGGFTSARIMKAWGKRTWKNAFLTAGMVPGQIFVAFFILNLFVWSTGSSAAVPFWTFITLMCLWLFVELPFVVIGSVLGLKKAALQMPVRTNQIPRHIPEQAWYMRYPFTVAMGGILPFGAVFIELFFILTSIWLNRYYYVFGCLFIVFIILIITCAEITVVMMYFQLCSEDYRWWWRSFLTAGSSGFYLFFYSVCYFFTSSLKITKFVSILLFFGYMGIISYIFFVITGTVGFLASFWFVRKIYGSIKID
eukprot:NODE_532_length_1994_cov_52.422108_g425_i0.p1 GENE.NODE_532_length_1994_cov_52.422108_g425_i0~~NODE_532_length_1994_cov_52.422108_g425_i0.p1  ORF type:complete len:610 (+),score=182.20 NODE_532_length_1994_cov_52.422108_g425_i0:273-1832(+)